MIVTEPPLSETLPPTPETSPPISAVPETVPPETVPPKKETEVCLPGVKTDWEDCQPGVKTDLEDCTSKADVGLEDCTPNAVIKELATPEEVCEAGVSTKSEEFEDCLPSVKTETEYDVEDCVPSVIISSAPKEIEEYFLF